MTKEIKSERERLDSLFDDLSPELEKKVVAKMIIAAKIDDARKKMNLSKIDLAKKFKKNPSEITRWLSGSHNFTIDTLVEIEEKLKTNIFSIGEKHERTAVQSILLPDSVKVTPQLFETYCYGPMFGLDIAYFKTFKGEITKA